MTTRYRSELIRNISVVPVFGDVNKYMDNIYYWYREITSSNDRQLRYAVEGDIVEMLEKYGFEDIPSYPSINPSTSRTLTFSAHLKPFLEKYKDDLFVMDEIMVFNAYMENPPWFDSGVDTLGRTLKTVNEGLELLYWTEVVKFTLTKLSPHAVDLREYLEEWLSWMTRRGLHIPVAIEDEWVGHLATRLATIDQYTSEAQVKGNHYPYSAAIRIGFDMAVLTLYYLGNRYRLSTKTLQVMEELMKRLSKARIIDIDTYYYLERGLV